MRANAAGSSVALPVPSEAPTAARVAGRPTLRAVGVVAQVALVLVLVRLFRIEEPYGFVRLAPLIFGGFVLHAVLPLRWRLPCFLALSLTAVLVLFRWPHGPGLVAIGLALVAICHLPLPFIARLGLLAVVGAALAAIRAGWIETPWSALPTLVLPVLASMFMFRLIVYLYDLRHERERASLWTRLSYFFLLPNVCFLLFPVVDYRTFRRTYYDAPALEIYQKGALWMLRGITHLLAYRLVYYHLTLAPGEVHDLGGLLQFTVSTYLLYLRISGQFHLVIGILCLFGFNLPETHRLYYLAASFNDFWRRINIYWKDFMMKIFYYPAFMQLRTAGLVAGVAVATVVVFLTTWLLHSYQWFWLQGTFPVTAQDGLFWGILGLLVVVNSIREMRQGRSRTLARPAWSTPRAFRHAASVIGMFLFMAVLWSLWSTSSVSDWLATVAAARTIDARTVGLLVAAGALLVAGGVAIQFLLHRGWEATLVGSHPSLRAVRGVHVRHGTPS